MVYLSQINLGNKFTLQGQELEERYNLRRIIRLIESYLKSRKQLTNLNGDKS